MVLSELPRSCGLCRSRITIENKEEVTEKRIDGRRILSVVCPACGETNEFLRTLDKLKIKEPEKWKQ
jgi:hypothetical protein